MTLGLAGLGLTAVTAVIARGSGGGARTPSVGMGHSAIDSGGGTGCHGGGGWPIVASYLAASAGGGGRGGGISVGAPSLLLVFRFALLQCGGQFG